MPWGNWGNPDDVNKALRMTGSDYTVPAASNASIAPLTGVGGQGLDTTTDAAFQNDLRRQQAEANGMKARAEAQNGGGPAAAAGGGGGMGGIMSAVGSMGGGGGRPQAAQGGGYQGGGGAAGGAAAQRAMVENEQAQRVAESEAKRNNIIGIFGKMFGMG